MHVDIDLRILTPASGVVDVCLIPEIGFSMDKLCAHVAKVRGGGRMRHIIKRRAMMGKF